MSAFKIKKYNVRKNKPILIFTVIVFACFGIVLLITSKAASFTASFEPEKGTLSSNASTISDATASNSSAIKFKIATTSLSGFRTCFPDSFCDSSGHSIIMNGVNIRFIGEQPAYTTLTQMQKIKAEGFNSVRFVMDWEAFQSTSGVGGLNITAFNNLRTAVNNAKAAGIYVILDPIHFGRDGTTCGTYALCIPPWARVYSASTYQGSAKSVESNAKDYIEKVSSEYANEPTVVAIDLVNEPKPEPHDDNALISMYNTLIGWARAKDPNKILMIESNSGDKLYSPSVLAGLSRRDNIIFSFHHYFGGAHTTTGSLISGCNDNGYSNSGWVCGNYTYENGPGYPAMLPNDLRAHIVANQNLISNAGLQLPIWIGEWGIIEGGTNAIQYRRDMTAIFKDMRIGRSYWIYNNPYNDVPSENMSMTYEGSTTPGDWKPWVVDTL